MQKVKRYATVATAGVALAGISLRADANPSHGLTNSVNSVQNTLYPILYTRDLGPYAVAVIGDVDRGNVKDAKQALGFAYDKAESLRDSFAEKRINEAYVEVTGKELAYRAYRKTEHNQGYGHVYDKNYGNQTPAERNYAIISIERKENMLEERLKKNTITRVADDTNVPGKDLRDIVDLSALGILAWATKVWEIKDKFKYRESGENPLASWFKDMDFGALIPRAFAATLFVVPIDIFAAATTSSAKGAEIVGGVYCALGLGIAAAIGIDKSKNG